MRYAGLVLMLSVLSTPLMGQRAEPLLLSEDIQAKRYAPAPRLAEMAGALPLASIPPAVEAATRELDDIRLWNEAHRTPARNGFTRSIPDILQVRLAPGESSKGGSSGGGMVRSTDRGTIVWSGSVRVEKAHRLRIHLRSVHIPAGAVFWVYGAGEEAIGFGSELIDDRGELYTPSIGGETAYLELEIPSAAGEGAAFEIADVLELVGGQAAFPAPDDEPTCLVDATCVTSATLDVIDSYRRSVAQLQYVKSGGGFVCTGGLINDKDTSTIIPYLLTANHCFSDQSAASSLEAFWDYRTATCGGSFPDIASSPRSSGSQLLSTSANSDFTFIRLNSVPSGRALLGWDASPSAIPNGTMLHRISHPFPDAFSDPGPQSYSTTLVDTVTGTCPGRPRSSYVYSTGGSGGVYGGSSGSPVILAGGYVVGQLLGSCGPDPSAGCDIRNATVDGAFSATYSSISSFLQTTPTGVCTPSTTVACVLNNRFRVTVLYRGAFDNGAADTQALVKPVTGFSNPAYETAFFYFNNPNNIEMLIKLLDQGNVDGAGRPTIAVLFGSATPLRIELNITDTQTGAVRSYKSEFGQMKGQTDFTAFVK